MQNTGEHQHNKTHFEFKALIFSLLNTFIKVISNIIFRIPSTQTNYQIFWCLLLFHYVCNTYNCIKILFLYHNNFVYFCNTYSKFTQNGYERTSFRTYESIKHVTYRVCICHRCQQNYHTTYNER